MVFQPGYCNSMLSGIFGLPPRLPDEPLGQLHFDMAAGLQGMTERVVFHLLEHPRECSTAPDLCLAGGIFQKLRLSRSPDSLW
jgi:carbamoyltransferase